MLTPVWPAEPAGRERRAISKAGARIVNSHLVGPPDVTFGSIATGQFNEGSGLCPLCAVSDRNVALLQTQLFAINAGHLGSRLIALRWLSPGEAHDNRLCSVLLNELSPRTMSLADRGYDADWIRALASEQGAWANIPPKRNRKEAICFSPYLYRARNLVERFFNKIKQCRRIATRYDRLAANYLAFIKLASIRIWLRAYESAP